MPRNYRPGDTPINSSAIMPIDSSQFELQVEEELTGETVELTTIPDDTVEMQVQSTGDYHVSWRVSAQRSLNQLVYQLHRNRVFQTAWATLVVICFAVIAFMLTARLDHVDDDMAVLRELEGLETQLVVISSKWSPEEMSTLRESVESADTRRVFTDYQALAIWLQEKAAFADQLGLEFGYTLGERSPARIDDMYEVPIVATITRRGPPDETYLRAIEFLKRVISTPYYVEISRASLKGQGDGAQELKTTLRIWVHSSVRDGASNAQ